jgi:mitogen-activated protein kinase 1/3
MLATFRVGYLFCLQLMGLPTEADLRNVTSQHAIRSLQQLPRFVKQPLAEKFPHLPPLAVDLIEKMLAYDPSKRITGISSYIK